MKRLEGKVAIVTGSGRGLGRGIALRLSSEGAAVAVADLDPQTAASTADELREQGGRALSVQVDISRLETVRKMVATVERELGPIDILVNNAGWEKAGPFIESDEETWDKILAINLKGPIGCCRAVLDSMIARGGG